MSTVKANTDVDNTKTADDDTTTATPSDIEALLPQSAVVSSPTKEVSVSKQSSEAPVRVQVFALLVWMIK